MTDKVLIGVLGRSGHGKDEFSKEVIRSFTPEYSIERIALADALKDEVNYIGSFAMCVDYGIPYDHNQPPDKQRLLLQYWGMHQRDEDPFYWIKRLEQRINASPARIICIPDVRFVNEELYIHSGTGYTVRVIRENYVGLMGQAAGHISENELVDYPTDFTIRTEANNLDRLKEQSREVFKQICKVSEREAFSAEELLA